MPRQTATSEYSKPIRDLLERRYEALGKYKQLGAETRKLQAEMARLDAKLAAAGLKINRDYNIW